MTRRILPTVDGPELRTTKETENLGPSWSTRVMLPVGGVREYVSCSGDTMLGTDERESIVKHSGTNYGVVTSSVLMEGNNNKAQINTHTVILVFMYTTINVILKYASYLY